MLLESDRLLPIVSMQLVFTHAGAINDGKLPGLAVMAANLLEEGTRELGAVGFARKLDERAIQLSINAGRETLVFEITALKEQFEPALALLLELLGDPNLTPEALNKVQNQTIGSLKRRESDFDHVASRGLSGLLYKETPLAYPTSGTLQTVPQITLEAIETHLSDVMVQERAIVLFGGDLSGDEALQWGEKLLSAIGSGEAKTLPRYEASATAHEKQIQRDTQQAYIYFGSPFYRAGGDEESYKASVAAFILGSSGFGSRLMEEIRVKRGYAYSAFGRINLGLTTSNFRGHLQTKPENQEAAIALVREVVAEFVEKGATQKELDEARQFLLGAEPLRNETMSQRLSRAFNDFYRGKPQGWSQAQLEKIEALTLEDLNAFIREHEEILNLSFFVLTR